MAFVVAPRLTASNRFDEAKRFWLIVSEGKRTNFWWRVFAMSTLSRYSQPPGGQTKPREV